MGGLFNVVFMKSAMRNSEKRRAARGSTQLIRAVAGILAAAPAFAGSPYQPPGANLTLGDVTHGQRVQSASSNPAAGAADNARSDRGPTRGTVLSFAGGIEYGNVDEIFQLYDDIANGYQPTPLPPDTPSNLPETPGGIDLGQIWDALDPDTQAAIEAVAAEVTTQVALLTLISQEGYARAWLAGDAPIMIGQPLAGGTWTFGVNWSGSSKAFGIVDPIDFDQEEAERRLQEWFDQLPTLRPEIIALSDDVDLDVDPDTNAVLFSLDNDSSLVTKAARTTDLSFGYSRPTWSTESGTLFLGVEGHLYLQQLSRFSARYGDITDSEELFDEIRNADFRSDEGVGVDIGALWVGENFQLGAQLINVNEPEFKFPEVNIDGYTSAVAIAKIRQDQIFVMDRQFKLEGSWFSRNRKWSLHAGYDVDPVTDALGDRYQWTTLSVGYASDNVWVPSARFGVRQNLAGTELGYLSAGITAFKYINFDVGSALDTVSIDGRDLPQGLMLSLGFNITW
jgi:hypothetical protein